jgi:hypothetical protein
MSKLLAELLEEQQLGKQQAQQAVKSRALPTKLDHFDLAVYDQVI